MIICFGLSLLQTSGKFQTYFALFLFMIISFYFSQKMIVRIVKMTFQEDKTDTFREIFEHSKVQIRHFPGCIHLELWQDVKQLNIYYTYSLWENNEALEKYRHSDLFNSTWSQTKILFAAKPEAVSLQRLVKID
jgi:quinol monooxygenase YgiN